MVSIGRISFAALLIVTVKSWQIMRFFQKQMAAVVFAGGMVLSLQGAHGRDPLVKASEKAVPGPTYSHSLEFIRKSPFRRMRSGGTKRRHGSSILKRVQLPFLSFPGRWQKITSFFLIMNRCPPKGAIFS